MKVTIIGSGYVGLVTGACLADIGNDVVCLDLDEHKIRILNDGGVPIYEPGLQELIQKNIAAKRLHFTTDVPSAVAHGAIQFIAVGTPSDEDGSADLRHVLAAARNIGRHMGEFKVVVNKSTVPVGTAERVEMAILDELTQREIDVQFAVVSNPEFLKEGAAIQDFTRPDRVVVGASDDRAIMLMRALYAPYTRNHDRFMLMDVRSAELTKYAANAMLATRISFMNELANLADKIGADIEAVRLGIGSDSRIGYSFLYAGCGYGGSCFPKDVTALIRVATEYEQPLRVLSAVEQANTDQKNVLAHKIIQRFGGQLSGRTFAVWGLAFKPNTDDMREAPSLYLIEALLSAGAQVRAYDPAAMEEAHRVIGDRAGLSYVASPMQACAEADALVIVTEWREFRNPDFEALAATLRTPILFDGRNLFAPELPRSFGIEYHTIGRNAAVPSQV